MQKKLISNREVFRQLLARDILAVLEDLNAGTCVDLATVKNYLGTRGFNLAEQHYYNLHTSRGWGYLDFKDRFYRALQSINDKGYGISIRKHTNNKLYVFSTTALERDAWKQFVADNCKTWTADYNMNAGYRKNTQLDEVA